MNKIKLNDGQWFDKDEAALFEGQQPEDESPPSENLYLTRLGSWVLNRDDKTGTLNHYSTITERQSANFFIRNIYDDDEIPDKLLNTVENLRSLGDVSEIEV